MKKMIVLTSLWSFLFIFSFSMFGCSEDDDEFGTTAERGNEDDYSGYILIPLNDDTYWIFSFND